MLSDDIELFLKLFFCPWLMFFFDFEVKSFTNDSFFFVCFFWGILCLELELELLIEAAKSFLYGEDVITHVDAALRPLFDVLGLDIGTGDISNGDVNYFDPQDVPGVTCSRHTNWF